MLSATKGERPLCLFLDTNKWIDLGRAHYGRPGGEPFLPALTAIQRAVEAGTLVVPFMAVQAMEAQKSGDAERRERFISFLVDLSRNLTLPIIHLVTTVEVRNAIRTLLGRAPLLPVRSTLLQPGFSSLFGTLEVLGGTAEGREAIRSEILQPEQTKQCLINTAAERAWVERWTRDEREGVSELTAIRQRAEADLTPEQRYAVNLVAILSDARTCGVAMDELLCTEGIHVSELAPLWASRQAVLDFGKTIPTIHAPLTLTLTREKSQPIAVNDTRDLVWLSVALPYADIVVMERGWATVVERSGLNSEYKTEVMTDLCELPRVLKEHGC